MDILQTREVFHLAFLRSLTRSLPSSQYVLKGGSNLRFFFGSIRYSDDMDLDASGVEVSVLRDKVMKILSASTLRDTLRIYGIEALRLPDMRSAKQTQTVQRFKVHLLTSAGEDLSTKIEFSRRGFDGPILAESISVPVLAPYKLPPLIAPHYGAEAAVTQKIRALAMRTTPQARDVFDLYLLSARPEVANAAAFISLRKTELKAARETILAIGYREYRDTVITYLSPGDRSAYDASAVWDEIRLKAVELVERFLG